jgi:hypothetical protein
VSHDVRERRLSEPRWTVEKRVVERLAPFARGLDEDPEIRADPLLADELVQRPRAQRLVEPTVALEPLGCKRFNG